MHDINYINIGDRNLIKQRFDHPVALKNGGNLGDYVPFYFGGLSIMLYNIKNGHSGVEPLPQNDIVYICCKLDTIVQKGLEFIFTDGHAKNKTTRFFNDLTNLNQIDWSLVGKRYWNNTTDDNDRKRRKQAEFLIKSHVAPDCIDSIVVYDQEKHDFVTKIMDELGLKIPVHIDKDKKLYYQ